MLNTPVIYILFNRPDVTRLTFAEVRKQRPTHLHLIADGPRASRPADTERCEETRTIVENMIDWPCEVTRDYSVENLGCGRRLSSGLTAAFEQLGEAIVLEDDILPHPDFFPFCETMLKQHRSDPLIHSIGGFNPLRRYAPSQGPAVATMFNSIWGWASWQRSWKDYDFSMKGWDDAAVQSQLRVNTGDDLLYQHYADGIRKTGSGQLDTWDYQWTFAMLRHGRHAIASTTNFIENIGFAGDATHTHAPEPWLKGLRSLPAVPTSAARDLTRPDRRHDRLYSQVVMSGSPLRIALARFAARHPALGRLVAR